MRQAKTQQHTAVDTSAGEANTAERHSSTGYSKGGTITVDRRYFYRLELENDLYRRHLSRFEAGVAHKLATSVQTVLSESQESAQKKNEELALTEHCRKPIESDDSVVEGAERGKKRARESGQEEDEALAILQERFDVKRRKV